MFVDEILFTRNTNQTSAYSRYRGHVTINNKSIEHEKAVAIAAASVEFTLEGFHFCDTNANIVELAASR